MTEAFCKAAGCEAAEIPDYLRDIKRRIIVEVDSKPIYHRKPVVRPERTIDQMANVAVIELDGTVTKIKVP